jgi:WD40 repeat protein/TPR repeat protein
MDSQELELRWRTTVGSLPEGSASTLATYRPPVAPTVREAPPSPAAAATPAPGHFELLAELARGGMGVVHRARQASLDREVAVKRMLGAGGPDMRARFVAEALVTGQLAHPNIVPVHELERTDSGELLLAMKLVAGASWQDELKRSGPHDQRARLATLATVCQAVAFAHSRSIVHRDLKPANIMLGEFGEVLVMDWGLAAAFGPRDPRSPAPHVADSLSPCGTPAYMPPELAEGRGADQGPWTDVYLLGAILHEILTGRPPHARVSLLATLTAASESRPPVFDASVPAELAHVCTRALARDPVARFASVVAFREAIESYLGHRESLAIAAAAEASLSSAGEHGAPANVTYSRLAEAIAGFRQARTLWPGNEEAAAGERRAHRALAESALGQGDLALAETHARALDALAARPILDAVLARRVRERRGRRIFRGLQIGLATALALFIASLAYGLEVASEGRRRERAGAIQARRRAARLEVERLWDRRASMPASSIEPVERLLGDAAAVVSEIARLETDVATTGAPDPDVPALRRSADLLLSRTLEQELALWPRRLGAGARYVGTAVSPDGRLIAAGGTGELALWERATGRPRRALEGVAGVTALAFSPDGQRLAAGDTRGSVAVFEVATGRVLYRVKHEREVSTCAFSPDGGVLLTTSADRTIGLWDAGTGAPLRALVGHQGPVFAAVFTPSGREIVSGSYDRTVRVWDAATGAPLRTLEGHASEVRGVAVSSDGRAIATGSFDGTVGVWDLSSGKRTATFTPPSDGGERPKVSFCAFARDGRTVLGSTWQGALHAWDRGSGRLIWRRAHAPGPPALSPDGREVVVGRDDGGLDVLDAATGTPVMGFEVLHADATASAVAPDGEAVATGSEDGTLRLWDVARGAPVWSVRGHAETVSAIAFGPGGVEVLTGASDGTIRLWDRATGALLLALEPGPERVNALAFAPEGGAFAVAMGETVRLVALPSGKILGSLDDFAGSPFFVGFGAGGHDLVVVDAGAIGFYDRSLSGRRRRASAPPGSPFVAAALFRDRDELVLASARAVSYWTFGARPKVRGRGLPGAPSVRRCAVSPDGKTVALVLEDGTVKRFSTTGWDLDARETSPDAFDCGFTAGGDLLVVGHRGWLEVIRRPFGPLDFPPREDPPAPTPTRAFFSPDGDRVLVTSIEPGRVGRLTLRETGTGLTLRTLETGPVAAAAAFERGRRGALVALNVGDDGRLVSWDPVATAPVTTLASFPKEGILTLDLSRAGERVAVGFESGALRVVDRTTGTTAWTLTDHHERLEWCGFSPDGSLVHAVWSDGAFETRSNATGALVRRARVEGPVETCALSPDGAELLVGEAPTSFLYRLDPFELVAPLEGHRGVVVLAAFLGANEVATATAADGVLRIWDRTTGRPIRTVPGGALVAVFEPRDPGAPLAGVTDQGEVVRFARPLPDDPRVAAPELREGLEEGLERLAGRLRDHGTIAPRSAEEVPALAPESAPVASLEPLAPGRYEERGLALLLGQGVAPGGAAAGIAWLRSAAASGSTRAMTRLAWALERGLGARDASEAKRLRETARAAGDPLAAGDLEAAALRGDPLARALLAVKARDRAGLERAASGNEPDALIALADSDPSRARQLLERAVALGDPRAALELAAVEAMRDPLGAIELYERAGKLGERGAWAALARIFDEGKVVARDEERARAYRKRADADE